MGGAVSAGEDNDELIDNLVESEYIKTPYVERIFRAVDRGDYYLEGCKENAYRDLAWKHGNIHLSAPCIYSEVMESLKLGSGMSFLNLGSGTGYLSTMAGLVLGVYGVNHGVELHSEVVDYAIAKLDEFQTMSPALDKYEFCPPSFVVGNCLLLDSTSHQYDRVYCGASCPSEHENYMKNLVRIGGILVMPLNDHLLQVTRTGETTFEVKNVLPVSFASLVPPHLSEAQTFIKLPEKHPLRLKEICRSAIRILLRANAETENPSLRDKKKLVPSKRRKHKRRIRKVVIPVFEDRESSASNGNASGDEQTRHVYNDNFRCAVHSTNIVNCGCFKMEMKNPDSATKEEEIDVVTRSDGAERESSIDDGVEEPTNSHVSCRQGNVQDPESKNVESDEMLNMVTETVIPQHTNSSSLSPGEDPSSSLSKSELIVSERQVVNSSVAENMQISESDKNPGGFCSHGNGDSGIDNISDESMPEESSSDPEKAGGETGQANLPTSVTDSSDCRGGTDRPVTKLSPYLKRSAEENDDDDDNSQYGETRITAKCCRKAVVFKHIDYSDVDSDDLDDFESDSGKESFPKDYDGTREKSDLSCYTYLMKQKINTLPLPQYLKMYLNFSRPV